MIRRPPRSTRTYPLFPSPALFRSVLSWRTAWFRRFCKRLVSTAPEMSPGRVSISGSRPTQPTPGRSASGQAERRYGLTTRTRRSAEHASELLSLMDTSYAVLFLQKTNHSNPAHDTIDKNQEEPTSELTSNMPL